MREIKFRAWDKKEKEMFEPMNISWRCGHIDCVHHAKNHKGGIYLFDGKDGAEFELMQFTGLLDKNGKEIYEGDVVRNDAGTFPIVFHSASFSLKISESLYQVIDTRDCFGARVNNEGKPTGMKVIGNVHEHPHLLQ